MTDWWNLYGLGLGSGLAAYLVAWCYPGLFRPPVGTNYRGRRIPIILGIALTAAFVTRAFLFPLRAIVEEPTRLDFALLLGIVVVFGSGLYDDFRPRRIHGLGAHFKALARGHVTSGIIKLIAGLASGAAWAWANRDGFTRSLLTIVVVAGCTNLWNLFDVRPGRALKLGLGAALPLFFVTPSGMLAALVFAILVILPLDLNEFAMLGDGGSTVLGFVIGVALEARLSFMGMVATAALIIILHVLAETMTLSRIIEAIAPLRWFDRLGRIRHEGPGTEARREDSSIE